MKHQQSIEHQIHNSLKQRTVAFPVLKNVTAVKETLSLLSAVKYQRDDPMAIYSAPLFPCKITLIIIWYSVK